MSLSAAAEKFQLSLSLGGGGGRKLFGSRQRRRLKFLLIVYGNSGG
jgi:hypothetical protein